jgi:hypothetical protein
MHTGVWYLAKTGSGVRFWISLTPKGVVRSLCMYRWQGPPMTIDDTDAEAAEVRFTPRPSIRLRMAGGEDMYVSSCCG